MTRKIRGSGFRSTLSAILPFSILWSVVVVIVASPVIVVSVIVASLTAESLRGPVWLILALGLGIIVVGVVGLAVFTTARIAGPFVALQRAFEDVRDGDMNRRLSFRRGDRHLRILEGAFNEMMSTMRERAGGASGDADSGAEDVP